MQTLYDVVIIHKVVVILNVLYSNLSSSAAWAEYGNQ